MISAHYPAVVRFHTLPRLDSNSRKLRTARQAARSGKGAVVLTYLIQPGEQQLIIITFQGRGNLGPEFDDLGLKPALIFVAHRKPIYRLASGEGREKCCELDFLICKAARHVVKRTAPNLSSCRERRLSLAWL